MSGKDEDETEGEETPITKKSIQQMVNDGVNSGLNARIEKALAKALPTALAPLLEQLQSRQPAESQAKDDESAEAYARTIKELEDKLRATAKRIELVEKERDESRTRERSTREDLEIDSALQKAGVKDPAYREALLSKWRLKGKVETNEDQEIMVNDQPLAEYVGSWAKSEGKAWIPAKPAGGSGNVHVNGNARGGGAQRSEDEVLRDMFGVKESGFE